MADVLTIGNIKLDSPVFLAPMAGYSDLPFRAGVRELGRLGLAFTEMIHPRSFLTGKNQKIAHLLATAPADTPLAHQLYGHEPDAMARGAEWLERHGAAILDINMGCPQHKIVRRGAGAGLLRVPDRALAVARAVVSAVGIPVTVKIRTLHALDAGQTVAFARELEQIGIAAVTVHARTCAQMFSGAADRGIISAVAGGMEKVVVVGNGDICSAEDATAMIRETGCDAIMIGRAALRDPWIIRDAARAIAGEPALPPPSRTERIDFMRRHLDRMAVEYGDEAAAKLFRKWIPQYAKPLRMDRQYMVEMLQIYGMDQLRDAIDGLHTGHVRPIDG